MPDLRENIQSALSSCATGSLAVSAKALYNTLGYESERGASWDLDEFLEIARLINKPLPMPAIVLFRHGEKDEPLVSIAIIRRRLNKRDAAKDVYARRKGDSGRGSFKFHVSRFTFHVWELD